MAFDKITKQISIKGVEINFIFCCKKKYGKETIAQKPVNLHFEVAYNIEVA